MLLWQQNCPERRKCINIVTTHMKLVSRGEEETTSLGSLRAKVWSGCGCFLPGFLAVADAIRFQSLVSLLTIKAGRYHRAISCCCFAAVRTLLDATSWQQHSANFATDLHQFGQVGTMMQ